MRRAALYCVALGGVLAIYACGGGRDEAAAGGDTETETGAAAGTPEAGAAGGGAPAAATPAGGGAVRGTISFSGTPPANPPIDMSEEPDCQAEHTGTPTDPVVVVSDGKLANVFVYVKSGLPEGTKYPAPKAAAVLDQDGCLYHPRVFGVMVGQPIQIRNSDPVLHNIKAVPKVNRGFNVSQPSEGMKTNRTFSKPEMMVPLECNVHGWMHAGVGVMSHPFFAVSGTDGTFAIEGLPAGTYEIEAWHEKLGTRTTKVTVPETGSVTADITFGEATS